jgi:hypothetical protein
LEDFLVVEEVAAVAVVLTEACDLTGIVLRFGSRDIGVAEDTLPQMN